MSLTGHLDLADSPVREFFASAFPVTKPFANAAREALAQATTLLPAFTEDRYPYSLIGQAVDFRIRMFYSGTFTKDVVLPGLQMIARRNTFPWLATNMAVAESISKNGSWELYAADRNDENEYKRLRLCILLAWFEAKARSGVRIQQLDDEDWSRVSLEELLTFPDQAWIDDARQIVVRFASLEWPKCYSQVVCNPLFEGASDVGGADGDLILDRRLVDIKTTKSPQWRRDSLYQLLGYCILDYSDEFNIEEIGLYWARQGRMVSWNIDDVIQVASDGNLRSIEQARTEFKHVVEFLPNWIKTRDDVLARINQ